MTASVPLAAQITADGMAPAVPGGRDMSVIAPRRDLLAQALGLTAGKPRSVQRLKVDLGPVVDQITAYLNDHGIPLHQDYELSGEDGIVFSAAFRVDDSLPDMQFHIGDRGPLDAFYGDDGFRLSLSWPIVAARHLALHIEGGEDGAFGNWAVVGVQWHHPRQPMVIGFGMPIALDDASGPVAVVVQMRLILP
jgi:hypothetical protein